MTIPSELLFGTSAAIDIYKGRKRIEPYFDTVFEKDTLAYLSVVSVAELWRGLRIGESDQHEALLRMFHILPMNLKTAKVAGQWMNRYVHDGLGWMDCLLTATASMENLPVLTRDKKLANILSSHADFILY